MGDISFSGGFETMAAGKDPEGWADMVTICPLQHVHLTYFIFQLRIGHRVVSGWLSYEFNHHCI